MILIKNILLLKLIDIIQYTVLFSIITYVISTLLDKYIFISKDPKFYKDKSRLYLLYKLILSLLVIIIAFYFIYKIRKYIPKLTNYLNKNYHNDRILDLYVMNIVCVYVYMYLLSEPNQILDELKERNYDNTYGFI